MCFSLFLNVKHKLIIITLVDFPLLPTLLIQKSFNIYTIIIQSNCLISFYIYKFCDPGIVMQMSNRDSLCVRLVWLLQPCYLLTKADERIRA